MNKLKHAAVLSLLMAATGASAADWQINNAQSQLNFISTKKQNIAEIHRFGSMTGQLKENGDFAVDIDLNSVDTGVEIRDVRMKEFLFDVIDFPTAQLTAKIDPALISDLAVGASSAVAVDGQLRLHGQEKAMTFDTLITKVSDSELLVVSAQPVILNVTDYQLGKGVEKLKELAGLPSISYAVPVSFYLTLNAK